MNLIIKQIYSAQFNGQLTFRIKKIKRGRVIISCMNKNRKVVGTIILNKSSRGTISSEEYMEYLQDAG